MKNLIWDLATIIRDAWDAGRVAGSWKDYEPPSQQFERVTKALEGSATTVVNVNQPLTSTDKAEQVLKNLGFTFINGAWIPPLQAPIPPIEAKFSKAVEVLEELGFTFDGESWKPLRNVSLPTLLDALLRIRELCKGPFHVTSWVELRNKIAEIERLSKP